MGEFRSWMVYSWSQTDLTAKSINTREVLWQWSRLVAPTLTETLIYETGSLAGNAAGALGAAAGRGSWRVCWWRGASGALKRGTPPVCAGGTSASGARRSPELRPQTGQTLPFGTCRCVCGSVARGPMSCNVARGWRRLGRSACAVARQQWSPARRSPCCTQYAHWWGRSTSSLTGSACVWDDCCPSRGTSPHICSGELPEHRSQKWDPNTSLQTGSVGVSMSSSCFHLHQERLDADTWGFQILKGGGDAVVVLRWAPGCGRGGRAARPFVLLLAEQWHRPGNHCWLTATL